MPSREASPGRAAMAWSRACAARARWVGRYARATAWPVRFPGLELDAWTTSPFGSALAEAVGAGEAESGLPPPLPHRRVADLPPPEPSRQEQRHPSFAPPPPAPSARPAQAGSGAHVPAIVTRGKVRAPVVAASAAAVRARVPRTILARLAGIAKLPPSSAPQARRSMTDGAVPSTARRPRPATPPAAASAALGGRLVARLTGRLDSATARGPASGSSVHAAPVPALSGGGESAWQRGIAAAPMAEPASRREEVRTIVPDPGACGGPASAAPPTPMPPGWRRPVATPTPGLAVRERPVQSAAGAMARAARHLPVWDGTGRPPGRTMPRPVQPANDRATGAGAAAPAFADADDETPSQVSPLPLLSRPALASRPEPGAAGTGAAQGGPPLRPVIDPVDFAVLLRAALLDDARRHGIEV